MISALAQVGGSLTPEMVGTIIGAVVVSLIGGGAIGKRTGRAEAKAEALQIGPQPFIIDFKKEFLTRAEHDVYRSEVRGDFHRMEASIQRMTDKVETKHMELLATIERAAKTGVDGRVHLWEALKPMSNELAALKATSNVADQLGKLAETLKQNQPQATTTHGKTSR